MVLEVAVLDVLPGASEPFQAAFLEAQRILSSSPGYQRHELRRCIEASDRYLLLVWWDSLESHTLGFRKSPAYQRWRELLHHFYDPFPVVEHYVPVSESASDDAIGSQTLGDTGGTSGMARFEVEPIGRVEGARTAADDDPWGAAESCIVLSDRFGPDALHGLEAFSHVEVLFLLHQVDPSKVVSGVRHPRNNPEWPAVGIFAQRAKNRPNRIGSTVCKVMRIEGRRLFVAELDATHGTPVLDIKPVLREFLPREDVRQPEWSRELMSRYWERKAAP